MRISTYCPKTANIRPQVLPGNLPQDGFKPGPPDGPENTDLASRGKFLKVTEASKWALGSSALAFLPGQAMNYAAHQLGFTSAWSGLTAVATFAGGLAIGLYYSGSQDPAAEGKATRLASGLGMAGVLVHAAPLAPTAVAVLAGVTALAHVGAHFYSQRTDS